jgi:hypothetical protein
LLTYGTFVDVIDTVGSPEITQIVLSGGTINFTTVSPYAAAAVKLYRADGTLVYFWFKVTGDTNAMDPAFPGGVGQMVTIASASATDFQVALALNTAIGNYSSSTSSDVDSLIRSVSFFPHTIKVATRHGASGVTVSSFSQGDTGVTSGITVTQLSASRTSGMRFPGGHSFSDGDQISYNLEADNLTSYALPPLGTPTVPAGLTNHATYYVEDVDGFNIKLHSNPSLTSEVASTTVGEGGHKLHKYVDGGYKRTLWFSTGFTTDPTPIDSITLPISISPSDTDVQVARKFRDTLVAGSIFPYARFVSPTVVRLLLCTPTSGNFIFSTPTGDHSSANGDQSDSPSLTEYQTGVPVAKPYTLKLKIFTTGSASADIFFDNTTSDRDQYVDANLGNSNFLVLDTNGHNTNFSNFRNVSYDMLKQASGVYQGDVNGAIFMSFSPFVDIVDYKASFAEAYGDGPEGDLTIQFTYRIIDTLINLG